MKATTKRFFASTLMVTAIACVANMAAATQQDMINSMIDQQLKAGEFKSAAQCLGVTESALANASKAVMTHCLTAQNMNSDSLMEQCAQTKMQEKLGVSANKVKVCKDNAENELNLGSETEIEIANIEAEINKLEDAYSERDLTSQEQKKLASLESELQKLQAIAEKEFEAEFKNFNPNEKLAEFGATLELGAKNTEHKITLPIYSNSQIKSHWEQGTTFGETHSLPVAMFSSSDSSDKIAAFYKTKLKHFTYKNLGDGEHIFMEKMPPNFNILTHMEQVMTTQHVTISVSNTGQSTEAIIEIGYKAK